MPGQNSLATAATFILLTVLFHFDVWRKSQFREEQNVLEQKDNSFGYFARLSMRKTFETTQGGMLELFALLNSNSGHM